jgi:hypothetical protein
MVWTVADAAPDISGGVLDGRLVLIVQRLWVVANALANAFEANVAQVLLTTNSRSGLAFTDHPNLSAAVPGAAGCPGSLRRGAPSSSPDEIGSTTNSPQRPFSPEIEGAMKPPG